MFSDRDLEGSASGARTVQVVPIVRITSVIRSPSVRSAFEGAKFISAAAHWRLFIVTFNSEPLWVGWCARVADSVATLARRHTKLVCRRRAASIHPNR